MHGRTDAGAGIAKQEIKTPRFPPPNPQPKPSISQSSKLRSDELHRQTGGRGLDEAVMSVTSPASLHCQLLCQTPEFRFHETDPEKKRKRSSIGRDPEKHRQSSRLYQKSREYAS